MACTGVSPCCFMVRLARRVRTRTPYDCEGLVPTLITGIQAGCTKCVVVGPSGPKMLCWVLSAVHAVIIWLEACGVAASLAMTHSACPLKATFGDLAASTLPSLLLSFSRRAAQPSCLPSLAAPGHGTLQNSVCA